LIASYVGVPSIIAAIAASVTTFAVTNVDDLFLLGLFFGRRVAARQVIAGQYLGFAGIVLVSLMGLWASLTIPRAWFRCLGLIPLAVGIKHLSQVRNNQQQGAKSFNVLSIAGTTLANGADNVGIYVPFFAISRAHLWLVLSTYALLLPIWCLIGKWLGQRPVVLRSVERYGHWIVPIVFVGLGLHILLSP
jgi:cadmium resistance protein CadD (predicted permease)